MAFHDAVAAVVGGELLLIGSALGVFYSVPLESTTGNGVEAGVLWHTHGEVQRNDAIAATWRCIDPLVIAWCRIGLSVPDKAVATFVVIEFIGDLVVHDKVKVDDAVAAADSREIELSVVGARLVVNETETMFIIHTRLSMPTAAVIEGNVVVGIGGDVNQHRVLAFAVYRIVLQADQNGVIVDVHIVKTIT